MDNPRYHSGALGPLSSGPLRDGLIYREAPLSRPVREVIEEHASRRWRETAPPPPPGTPTPYDLPFALDATWLRGQLLLPPLPPGISDEVELSAGELRDAFGVTFPDGAPNGTSNDALDPPAPSHDDPDATAPLRRPDPRHPAQAAQPAQPDRPARPHQSHVPPNGADEAAWRAWQQSPQGHAWNRLMGPFANPPIYPAHPVGPLTPDGRPARTDLGGERGAGGAGNNEQGTQGQERRPPTDPRMVVAGGHGHGHGRGYGHGYGHGGYGGGALVAVGGPAPLPEPQPPRGWSRVGPGGPQGYLIQQRQAEEVAMQALIEQSRPWRPHEEPPCVVAAVRHTPGQVGERHPGLTIAITDEFPVNILGQLYLGPRKIWLSSRLFEPRDQAGLRRALLNPPATYRQQESPWELYIEKNRTARFVLASLFTAWYAYAPMVARAARCSPEEVALGQHGRKERVWGDLFNPYHPLCVAFAPVNAAMCKAWHARWQTPYYAEHWQRLLALLVNQQQMDAQTRTYLDLYDDEPLPKGRELERAIFRAKPAPTAMERRRYGEDGAARFAWDKYLDFLAERSHAPRVLPFSKLTGAYARIESGDDLSRLTSELIAEDAMLGKLRRAVATARDDHGRPLGYGLSSELDVGLYLAEPRALIPAMSDGRRDIYDWR